MKAGNVSQMVSVVVPCFNNERYVAYAIESIIDQTYNNWELVIVNDGSTDNSDEVIKKYVDKDTRIHYIMQGNSGVSAARNRGVQEASGEYICFLDADDWLAPVCLQTAVSIFQRHNDLRLFYLKNQFVGNSNDGKEFVDYYGDYQGVLLWGMANHAVIKRADFINIGGYDEHMNFGWEDWDFSIRFLHHHCSVIVSDEVLYYYRQYSNNGRVSFQACKNVDKVQKYIYCKNIDIYAEYFGLPIMQCRWETRRLPQLCKKIMSLRQRLYDWLKSIKTKR